LEDWQKHLKVDTSLCIQIQKRKASDLRKAFNQIPGRWLWVNFLTSDSVGFCPKARKMSPIWDTWTQPSPFWSKSWNASWKSNWRKTQSMQQKVNRPVKCRPIMSKVCNQLSLPYKVWKLHL
jgi:hypothetical protein